MATKQKETPENDEYNIELLNLEREGNIMAETEEKLERLNNTSKVKFLNITPKEKTAKWAIIGRGITSNENSYGAKTTDEHWIIENNERHSLDGYSLGSDVEQTAYKGDGVFEYIDDIMFYMKKGEECETQQLEIYKYRVDESDLKPKYDARLLNVLIVPDTDAVEGGQALKIKYKIVNTMNTPMYSNIGKIFNEIA